MSILNPTPNSVELTVVENLSSNSSYHPTLYPFNASLYMPGSNIPFLSLETPKFEARNNATVNIGPQQVNITQRQFTDFVLIVASNKVLQYSLIGKGDLKEGGLPKISVNYQKYITMKCMLANLMCPS